MGRAGTFLEVRNISKRFGGVIALDDVSLKVHQGEVHAICGENGAGKSTLMKILCGQHTDYTGKIFLRGTPVRFGRIRDAERAGISIIHQELNLVEELSVAANIFLGREISRLGFLSRGRMTLRARQLLHRLDCDIDPDSFAGSLRIGDQQLVEISKAIGLGAEILIMDEPTSALTETEVGRLDRVINELRSSGVTILYISHKMDEIFRLSDRVTVLRDGTVVGSVETKKSTPVELTRMMVGREPVDHMQRIDQAVGASPMMSVRRLSRRWPGHPRQWRIRDVSFDLFPGEILGIAGLMGAGRTELLESLYGCASTEVEGAVLLDGERVKLLQPADAIRNGISMVTEDRKRLGIFNNLDIGANITLCALGEFCAAGILNHRRERTRCEESINEVRIKANSISDSMGSLSGGNQQKCLFARSLQTRPRILLLDDPTRGVDVGAKAEIYRLLGDLANDGLGIVMSSSELPELLQLCDRIMVLCEGRVTAIFDNDEGLDDHQIMQAATGS